MQTQLSQFCEHFDRVARPLLKPLEETASALAAADDDTPGAELGGHVEEMRHQLEMLVDKVRDQQAYVLIFGPLKSGKSTLMNAVAGAYVSEVSSLPAYPCLVFVGHGESRKYVVHRYDDSDETLGDPGSLRRQIADAHVELARIMRQTEDAGEQFEPQEHYPRAIRRVDVEVPAPKLAESGAVLVDTPGLYTRMRFGYDRMTRDFRNAAACAIFVVRSDTLFLEQVFTEFHQLLELFSRIFLVVNIDTNKRDLGADGRLMPSLEQRNPERIIEAFENLAMSAPLKHAEEEGRLRVHPIDLMSAAAGVLRHQADDKLPPGFIRFRDELNDYLASTDYLVAFLRDSLQRASTLAEDAHRLGGGEEAVRLRDEVGKTQDRRGRAAAELSRIDRLLQQDWSPCFARFDADIAEEVERTARDKSARLGRAMLASIDTWFLSSHSLDWLLRNEWMLLSREYRDLCYDVALRRFEQSCLQPAGGLDLDRECREVLGAAGIDIANLRRDALDDLGPPQWSTTSLVPLDADEIPIKRGLLDMATFRSKDRVRQRVFGPTDRPDKKIEPGIKTRRLGEAGKTYMRKRVTEFRDNLQRTTTAATLRRFDHKLRDVTVAVICKALEERRPELERQLSDLEQHEQRLLGVLEPLSRLHAVASDVAGKLDALQSQYARQPVVLQPQPRRTDKTGDKTGKQPRQPRTAGG